MKVLETIRYFGPIFQFCLSLDGLEEIEAKHRIVGKSSVPLTTQKSYFKVLFYLGTLAKTAWIAAQNVMYCLLLQIVTGDLDYKAQT